MTGRMLHEGRTEREASMATDPVCGMQVTEREVARSFVYRGTTYYFCSAKCLNDFKANPAAYVHPEANEEAA